MLYPPSFEPGDWGEGNLGSVPPVMLGLQSWIAPAWGDAPAVVEPEAGTELVEVDEVAAAVGAAVVVAAIAEAVVVAAITAEVLRNDRRSVIQMPLVKKTLLSVGF
jgi:hypothetical protein